MTMRTSLTPYAASMRDPDPNGASSYARQAWRDHGAVVLTAEQVARLDWPDRELVRAIAVKVHGPR
jgi:hypothetical protein